MHLACHSTSGKAEICSTNYITAFLNAHPSMRAPGLLRLTTMARTWASCPLGRHISPRFSADSFHLSPEGTRGHRRSPGAVSDLSPQKPGEAGGCQGVSRCQTEARPRPGRRVAMFSVSLCRCQAARAATHGLAAWGVAPDIASGGGPRSWVERWRGSVYRTP